MPDIEEPMLAEVVQNCLCLSIRQAARAITQMYDTFLQSSGLRATQFNLLVALAFTQEVPLTQLAETLVMDRTTLARNLKPLERQGFLTIREDVEDRRVHLIRITPQGLQAVKEALPAWKQAQEQLKARLGQNAWDTLTAQLQGVTLHIPPS